MVFFKHDQALVLSDRIGEGTSIQAFTQILPRAHIGRDCIISSHCLIENNVRIGDRVTVQAGVQLWDGIQVGDDVRIGPNVTFATEKLPWEKRQQPNTLETEIESGVFIGAAATILPNVKIGHNAVVREGAVVTRSIPPNAIVAGNPAHIVGYVDSSSKVADAGAPGIPLDSPYASKVAGVSLIKLAQFHDIRGSLTVGEFRHSIPFEVKRYFMVFDVPSVETRGEHAHRECHQFLLCVRGRLSVVVDDSKNREEFLLDRPDLGLYLPPMVWGIQYKFSPDALLLVFASHHYDSSDYIRDYSDYLNILAHR